MGVDRLSVSFPVADFAVPARWTVVQSRPTEKRSVSVEVEGASFMIGVSQIVAKDGEESWWAKVEGNPARVGNPDGVDLLPVGELRDRMAPVFESAVSDWVAPLVSIDEFRVKRLDVARDFDGVQDVPSLLVGLAAHHRPWSRKNNLYNDGKRNGAQTLVVGSASSGVRLYDKWAESAGVAPAGRLRWEIEGRSAWCEQYASISRLGDVDQSKAEAFATNRWEWSAMGAEVCTRSELVMRVRSSSLTSAQQRGFLGWCFETSCGFESSMSRTTSAAYRRIQRELGVTLGPSTFEAMVMGRLDFDSGEIVMRVA